MTKWRIAWLVLIVTAVINLVWLISASISDYELPPFGKLLTPLCLLGAVSLQAAKKRREG